MAEIVENDGMMVDMSKYATKSQTNTALGFGILGTALGALAGGGGILGMLGGNKNNGRGCNSGSSETYIERKEQSDLLESTRTYYQNRISDILQTSQAFAELKQADIDNSFQLYKYSRDSYDKLNSNQVEDSFKLYKYTRDSNDMIMAKVAEVDKKVDIMAAVRPYQDALIDSKIDRNALLADYALQKRTCRMIEGQLVLPSTPTITGFGSYYNSYFTNNTTTE